MSLKPLVTLPHSRLLAAIATIFLTFPAFAQAPGSASATAQDVTHGTTQTLHVEAREVVLDVVVTDHSGKPVSTLEQKDFQILENGTEQRILSFTKPSEHVPPPNSPPITSAKDLIHAGNIPINIIILDELNTAFEDTSYGRASVEKYLAAQPPVLKQATTILSISDSGMKLIADYTQDRDALKAIVHKHFPVYPFRMMKSGDTAGPDAGERLARCLGSILQISQSVKGYKGRKSIIWVGRGFPSIDTENDVNADKAAEVLNASALVTAALLESRTVLNIIDPTPLSVSVVDYSDADFVSPNDLLNAEGANGQSLFPGDVNFADFAPATGGLAFFARNDVDKEIATAIDDGATYYTLVYSPSNKTDDPKLFRQTSIKLSDPNLVAWTRTGYYEAHHLAPGEKVPPPDLHQLEFDLMNAGISTVSFSGLVVSAEKETTGKLKVNVAPVGLDYRTLKSGAEIEEVTVMEVCFDAKNRPIEHHPEEKTYTVTDNTAPMSFEITSDPPKGTTRVRLVVRDVLNGHLGTVDLAP